MQQWLVSKTFIPHYTTYNLCSDFTGRRAFYQITLENPIQAEMSVQLFLWLSVPSAGVSLWYIYCFTWMFTLGYMGDNNFNNPHHTQAQMHTQIGTRKQTVRQGWILSL